MVAVNQSLSLPSVLSVALFHPGIYLLKSNCDQIQLCVWETENGRAMRDDGSAMSDNTAVLFLLPSWPSTSPSFDLLVCMFADLFFHLRQCRLGCSYHWLLSRHPHPHPHPHLFQLYPWHHLTIICTRTDCLERFITPYVTAMACSLPWSSLIHVSFLQVPETRTRKLQGTTYVCSGPLS